MVGQANFRWFAVLGILASFPLPPVAVSYEGYQMFSIAVETVIDVEKAMNIADQFDGVTVMKEAHNGKIILVVAAPDVNQFRSKVSGQGLEARLIYEDVQGLIDATTKRSADSSVLKRSMVESPTKIIDHTMYHNYPEIVSLLEELSKNNPDLMEISTLPHLTHEGREVIVVKLHGNSTSDEMTSPNPAVVIESGIHAREWITPAAQLWVIEELLQGYRSGDRVVTDMLDSLDWVIIPVANPDGYAFSHDEDRLWRKNRRYISFKCRGVDLNRNFDVAFNTTGVSNDCTRNLYLGFKPFSEPETSNVKALVDDLRGRLVAYLAVHSFSQLILVPWGYSREPLFPDNYEEIDRIAGLMHTAVQARYKTQWFKGQAYPLLGYAASGAGEDWALKAVPGIFAVCLELRPAWDDIRQFLLPPEEIVPSGEEYFDSLVAMAKELPTTKRAKTISQKYL